MTDKLTKPLGQFKERELEIINLMADGLSNKDIADHLYITKETVRWYNKQIYSKLGTSRRTEAIAIAREMGLIKDSATSLPDTSITIQHRLPVTTGPFIGRDDELYELSDILGNPSVRLVSIIATGGMGKSRLSLELGHHIKSNYAQGALFIDLASIRNPKDIAKSAITGLGLTITDNQDPHDVLLNYCREKELLLIFDNFEHILSGAPLISDILEIAPKVTIIATSRERLNLRVETVYALKPIIQEGVQLFREVATMMRPNIVIEDEEFEDIHTVVKLVGGSPLGLVLAATWVDVMSIVEIADEIKSNLDFLSSDMGDMPERQRSIHAVINPTWNRLNEKEQKAFMWASVFRSGFTRQLFQQLTGASARTLQTLLSRSLINHGHGRRYDMHPLLRQYAREKLEAHEMLSDAKNIHLKTFMNYSQTHAQRIFDGHYLDSLDALELEVDNVRAALDWSLKGNNVEHGVAIILAYGEFWLTRSRVMEAVTYVEKAVQLANHPKLYYWQSIYLDRLGHIDQAIESAQYVIEYGRANHDKEILAYGLVQSALMKSTGTEASPLFELALSHALKTDNQHLIANCHHYLSLIDSEQFTIDDPRSHLQQALKIFESLGDLHGISRVTNNIAIYYYDDERIPEAKELMDYSLQLKREFGDRAGEARRLTTLSMWAMAEEELEQAQKWLVASREICEELGELERLSYVLSTEGLLYLLMMDFEKAQATLEYNLQIDIDIQDYRGAVDIYSLLCQLHLLKDNLTDARLSLLKGIEAIAINQSQPTLLIIAYASYLWHKHELNACVPIVATIANREINTYVGSNLIINNYLLQPLVYRVQQHIGDAAWQAALENTSSPTIEEILEAIIDNPQI
jgi:predicted ATPase/DNA-binding CsgD family transcriptional regulator